MGARSFLLLACIANLTPGSISKLPLIVVTCLPHSLEITFPRRPTLPLQTKVTRNFVTVAKHVSSSDQLLGVLEDCFRALAQTALLNPPPEDDGEVFALGVQTEQKILCAFQHRRSLDIRRMKMKKKCRSLTAFLCSPAVSFCFRTRTFLRRGRPCWTIWIVFYKFPHI